MADLDEVLNKEMNEFADVLAEFCKIMFSFEVLRMHSVSSLYL